MNYYLELKKARAKIKTLKDINETLHDENDKISEENKLLEKDMKALSENNIALENEKKVYIDENRMLSNENVNLKKEIEKLKPLVDKLTLSSNKLELILKDQRDSNNKAGIGYNFLNKNEISSNKFVSSSAFVSTSRTIRYIHKIIYQKPVRTAISISASHDSTFYTTKHTYAQNSKIICYACNKVGHKFDQRNMLKKNNFITKGSRKI